MDENAGERASEDTIVGRHAYAKCSWLLLGGLAAFETLLVLSYFATISRGDLPQTIMRLFNLDGERNFGAWFSSSLLLLVGVALLVLATRSPRPFWPRSTFFILGGLGFIFLSADESLSLHESVTKFASIHADWMAVFPGNHGAWIPLYALIGFVCLLSTWRSLLLMWRHHRRQSYLATAGAAFYVVGAVVVEVAGYIGLFRHKAIQVGLEEMLEMFGITLILVSVCELSLKRD